jgi:hypothetical protein
LLLADFYAFCGEQLLVSCGESNIDPAKHAWAILGKLEVADHSSSGQNAQNWNPSNMRVRPPNRSHLRSGDWSGPCFIPENRHNLFYNKPMLIIFVEPKDDYCCGLVVPLANTRIALNRLFEPHGTAK